MEGGYTGVSCVRHSEHRDIDPVWKETDERGENRLFRDSGKDIVDLHQRLSFFSQETSAGCRPYSPWFPWGGEGPMIPGYKARWATGRQHQAPAKAESIEETPLRDHRQASHEATSGKTIRVRR